MTGVLSNGSALDEDPVRIGAKSLAEYPCLPCRVQVRHDTGVSELKVGLHEHELADHHILPFREGLDESPSQSVVRRVEVGGVDEDIDVEGDHEQVGGIGSFTMR